MTFNPIAALSVVSVLPHLSPNPSVMELGNQTFTVTDEVLETIIDRAPELGPRVDVALLHSLVGRSEEDKRPRTAEFYRGLGFASYTAIDINSRYGSLVMDLNTVLKDDCTFTETYDLVTNGGTGEHIFDQRAVFTNVHNLTKRGGVMLHIMPFLNWVNHGFYNFNPIVFGDVAAANRYRLLHMAVANRWGFAVPFDLTAAPAPQEAVADADAVRSVARRVAGRVARLPGLWRVADVARNVAGSFRERRPDRTQISAPTLAEGLEQMVPSPRVAGLALPRAVEHVMRHEREFTQSQYPILGNVMVVAAMQKIHDDDFVVPLQGMYLHDAETEAIRATYARSEML